MLGKQFVYGLPLLAESGSSEIDKNYLIPMVPSFVLHGEPQATRTNKLNVCFRP